MDVEDVYDHYSAYQTLDDSLQLQWGHERVVRFYPHQNALVQNAHLMHRLSTW